MFQFVISDIDLSNYLILFISFQTELQWWYTIWWTHLLRCRIMELPFQLHRWSQVIQIDFLSHELFVRLAWLKVYSGNVLYFQVLLGLCSFFTIALGGLLIGVIYGLITALVTKTTTEGKHYKLMTRAYRNFITFRIQGITKSCYYFSLIFW